MQLLKRFKSDIFYRNAVLFTFASLLTSGLNYLYYPVLARFIGIEEFGELQVTASFILQLSTVFSGINLINITLLNSKDTQSAKVVEVLQKTIFWIFIFISIVIITSSLALKEYFHFSSALPFILVVPSLLISAISVFWTAYLQAKSDFLSLSVYSVTTGIGKLLLSLSLVLLGLGVNGALVGIALSLGLSLVIVKLVTKHSLPRLVRTLQLPNKSEIRLIKPYIKYTIMVIVTLVITTVLLSIDTFIVKRLFSPEIAGHYAGISTIARIIFFASAPLVAVMLPEIREDRLNSNLHALRRTVLLSATLCIGGLLVFSLFYEQVTQLLLGDAFVSSAHLLPAVSILVSLATVTNIALNYLLALKSKLAVVIAVLSILLAVIFSSLFHDTIQELVISICLALLMGQIPFYGYILKSIKAAKS